VYTRKCSARHSECQVRFTGRESGFHRESADTMIRHEVLLMYWHVSKTMHGPGAESYGKMIEEFHRLSGGIGEALNGKRTLFMETDLLRRCVLGYLSRQRRPRRGCPTCPNGACKKITVDAKRMRNPVHLSSDGNSPGQQTAASGAINCGVRCIAERYLWPGKPLKAAREAASALSAAILGRKLRKGEAPFKEAEKAAFSSDPKAYFRTLSAPPLELDLNLEVKPKNPSECGSMLLRSVFG
jgi:hypothetical protein